MQHAKAGRSLFLEPGDLYLIAESLKLRVRSLEGKEGAAAAAHAVVLAQLADGLSGLVNQRRPPLFVLHSARRKDAKDIARQMAR